MPSMIAERDYTEIKVVDVGAITSQCFIPPYDFLQTDSTMQNICITTIYVERMIWQIANLAIFLGLIYHIILILLQRKAA